MLCGLAWLWAGSARTEVKAAGSPFSDWTVGIVAADWRASDGTPIEAFENSRRDLAEAFRRAGFSPQNITDWSLRPNSVRGMPTISDDIFAAIESRAKLAQAGCLIYFTSHGVPEGITLGAEGLLSPRQLDNLLDVWCGERPTVVVVSACFSGVFIPELAAPNRMIMTAARPDRTSFGCGPGSQYPYFDACVLESLPQADDFIDLAVLCRRCVARREREARLWPPSEPLTSVGDGVEDLFVFLNFEHSAR